MIVFGAEYRYTATSGCDNHMAGVSQSLDSVYLDYSLRLWTCHNSAIASARVLYDRIAPVLNEGVSLFLCEKSAYRLCRIIKCRVIRVHFHLCEAAGYVLHDPPVCQLFSQHILKIIPDVALAHGSAY